MEERVEEYEGERPKRVEGVGDRLTELIAFDSASQLASEPLLPIPCTSHRIPDRLRSFLPFPHFVEERI